MRVSVHFYRTFANDVKECWLDFFPVDVNYTFCSHHSILIPLIALALERTEQKWENMGEYRNHTYLRRSLNIRISAMTKKKRVFYFESAIIFCRLIIINFFVFICCLIKIVTFLSVVTMVHGEACVSRPAKTKAYSRWLCLDTHVCKRKL